MAASQKSSGLPCWRAAISPAGNYGNFVFFPSRVNGAKRQWLAVESMKYVHSPVRLVLAGKDEDLDEGNKIENAIAENGLRIACCGIENLFQKEPKLNSSAGHSGPSTFHTMRTPTVMSPSSLTSLRSP